MSSGWEVDSSKVISEKKCDCGQGTIIQREVELSSTKPPLRTRTEYEYDLRCPNDSCPSKK